MNFKYFQCLFKENCQTFSVLSIYYTDKKKCVHRIYFFQRVLDMDECLYNVDFFLNIKNHVINILEKKRKKETFYFFSK